MNEKEMQAVEEEYEEFMQELEGDREMRRNVNLYKKTQKSRGKTAGAASSSSSAPSRGADQDGGGASDEDDDVDEGNDDDGDMVRLDELLDGLEVGEDDDEEESQRSAKVLSREEASRAAAVDLGLPSTPFDGSAYLSSAFKFV